MKTSLLSLASLITLLALPASAPHPGQTYYAHYENVLGTSFALKLVSDAPEQAETAEQVALAEIDRLNAVLSSYDTASEFSRWQKTLNGDQPVSLELFEVLSLFDQWKSRTHGALSASAAIGTALWKKASANQALPGEQDLRAAVVSMKKTHWVLDATLHTARHLTTDPLVLNSFVKSYIIGKVARKVMDLPGISSCVINIGGDLVVAGADSERVDVANPRADAENDRPLTSLEVSGKAIATSGNYRRGFQIGSTWYSHILDVRTAMPVHDVISATVVADQATVAGALATAFNILTPEESTRLAGQFPGVEFLLVLKDGRQMASLGWSTFEHHAEKTNGKATAVAQKDSNPEFELVVELELARFEGRFRRPFVAVWVENEKKETVSNLALWYNKPRWLNELRKWYSKNYPVGQGPSAIQSISSATRSAGKYTLKWDGKDSQGITVPPGKYTVYIEVAREHGTYQLLHQEVKCKGKAVHVELGGGVEITAASVEYHKVESK